MHGHLHDGADLAEGHAPGVREPRPDHVLLQAAAAGRPDVLGARGLLAVQRAAGNGAAAALAEEQPTAELSGGSALDGAVRGDMEARLGADFGDVRVHTGDAAHAAATSVNALAYTSGSDIVFQHGQYDPSSSGGQTMLAHELTHVVQQRSGPVDGTDNGAGVSVSDPSDRFEREAVANAERVMSQPAPTPAAVQRHEGGDEAGEDEYVQTTAAPEEDELTAQTFVQRHACTDEHDHG